MTYRCAQRGCEFESAKRPDNCPVCNNPFVDATALGDANDELAWSDYTVDELLMYCESWGVDVPNQRTPKAQLIVLLEAAEAE